MRRILSAAACGLAAALTGCTAQVDGSTVGVVKRFGTYDPKPLTESGVYWPVAPWTSVIRVNTQVQRNEEAATVPTQGGLMIDLHTIMLFRVDPAQAPTIWKEIGEDYEAKVVDPYLRNAVRDVCAGYPAEALYTSDRTQIEGKLRGRLEADLTPRGFVVEQVMIQDPKMPDVVRQRIEAKMGAEQDAQKMEYVLRSKKLEADAKVVEAKGIAEAQNIIKKDLDDAYLRYLWIEALKAHQGATIYIPTGNDGMPFFQPADHGVRPPAGPASAR